MKRILPLIMLAAVSADAQTFTDRLQEKTAGQGSVTIYQDKIIEDLVNGKERNAVTATPARTQTAAPATKTTAQAPANGTANGSSAASSSPDRTLRKSYRIAGYRIQLYSGNDSRAARQKAYAVGAKAKEAFPTLPVYTHFHSPRWICRVGDFRTYEEAAAYLRQMRKEGAFNEASIVKCKIQIGY